MMNKPKPTKKEVFLIAVVIMAVGIVISYPMWFYQLANGIDANYGCSQGYRKTVEVINWFNTYRECTSFPIEIEPIESTFYISDLLNDEILARKQVNGVCVQINHNNPKGSGLSFHEYSCYLKYDEKTTNIQSDPIIRVTDYGMQFMYLCQLQRSIHEGNYNHEECHKEYIPVTIFHQDTQIYHFDGDENSVNDSIAWRNTDSQSSKGDKNHE